MTKITVEEKIRGKKIYSTKSTYAMVRQTPKILISQFALLFEDIQLY